MFVTGLTRLFVKEIKVIKMSSSPSPFINRYGLILMIKSIRDLQEVSNLFVRFYVHIRDGMKVAQWSTMKVD